MVVTDWVESLIAEGLLCDAYTSRFRKSLGKSDLVNMALDANGLSFIPQMMNSGIGLSIDDIKKEFAMYINGRYKRDKDGYTSCMYCGYNGDIDLDTSATLILGCSGIVSIDDYRASTVVVGGLSNISLIVPENSMVRVEVWDNSRIDTSLCIGNVNIKKCRENSLT